MIKWEKRIIRELQASKFHKIVAVVDKEEKMNIEGYLTIGMNEIINYQYDCIYVAILDKDIAIEVREELHDMGISRDVIFIAAS